MAVLSVRFDSAVHVGLWRCANIPPIPKAVSTIHFFAFERGSGGSWYSWGRHSMCQRTLRAWVLAPVKLRERVPFWVDMVLQPYLRPEVKGAGIHKEVVSA